MLNRLNKKPQISCN